MFPSAGQLISNLKQNFASEADVRAAFASWDSNKDGQISFAELKSAVQRSGQKLTDEDTNAIFVVWDIDQNGEIALADHDRDGDVSLNELLRALSKWR